MPKRLLNLGSTSEMSPLFMKRLKAINTMLLVCASNCFLYGTLLLYLGMSEIAQIVLALSVCFFVLLYLQSKKYTSFVRCVFLILLNLFIFFFVIILDKKIEVELLFSILIIIPLFFYEYKDYKKWILFSFLSTALLFTSIFLPNITYITIAPEQVVIVRTIVWVTLFLWISIFFYWTSSEYGKAELELISKNKSLLSLLESVKKNENELLVLNTKLSEKNKDMNNIIHIVSHDLREPVQTLVTGVSMIQRSDVDIDTKVELQAEIDFAKDELNYMYNGIRKYSNVCLEIENSEVDLNEVITEVAEKYRASINLMLNVDLLPIIRAQRSDIVILIDELISNSVKYNSSTTVEVNILKNSSIDEGPCTLSYIDNSIGFGSSEDDVFRMFYRKNHKHLTSKRGVGLALIKKIVNFYGGNIKSTPKSKGVKYTITLNPYTNERNSSN